MSIRRLKAEDAELACDVVDTFKTSRPSLSHMKDFLMNDHHYLYVAEVDSKAVGFLLAYELNRSDRDNPMMFFYEIEVLSDYREKGIGSALVNEVKAYCEKNNFMKMYVLTNESNPPAMRLYESTGGKRTTPDQVLVTWEFS